MRNFWLALSIISCCFGMSTFSMADDIDAEDLYIALEEALDQLTMLETGLENLDSITHVSAPDKRKVVVGKNVYELPDEEEIVTAVIRHKNGGVIVIDSDRPRKLTTVNKADSILPLSFAIYDLHGRGMLPELTDTYYRYPYETIAKTPTKNSILKEDLYIDFAVTVQGTTWCSYYNHRTDWSMRSVDYFSGMVLVTTTGVRLVHFQDDAGGPSAEIIGEDVVQDIVDTYPNANLAEIVAFMEMGDIDSDFVIDEVSQMNPVSLGDKVMRYLAGMSPGNTHPSERELQNVLTFGMVIQMIGGNAAAAPMVPRGKKLTTWGAIKSGR